jgi:hypothetical protein
MAAGDASGRLGGAEAGMSAPVATRPPMNTTAQSSPVSAPTSGRERVAFSVLVDIAIASSVFVFTREYECAAVSGSEDRRLTLGAPPPAGKDDSRARLGRLFARQVWSAYTSQT